MSKGSNPRPIPVGLKSFDESFEKIFGKKGKNEDVNPETGRVRYKAHPETGEMIPDYMWAQHNMLPKIPPRGHFIVRDYDTYRCPVTDRPISGRRQHRENLNRTGSRVYEGRESEQRAADAHNAHEEKKLDRVLDKSIAETLNDIKHQNNPPPERDKNGNAKASWTFGL